MSYEIIEKLISKNRSNKNLQPQGIVVHSTDNVGASAMNHFDYFNNAYRGASAHYFIDDKEILRFIPENEQSWHAGKTANSRFLSIELCEFDDSRFDEVWVKAIWLVAEICKRYGWNTDPVWSHRGISNLWHETSHQDPIGYFARHGKTWEGFLQEVETEINKKSEEKNVTKMEEKITTSKITKLDCGGYIEGVYEKDDLIRLILHASPKHYIDINIKENDIYGYVDGNSASLLKK